MRYVLDISLDTHSSSLRSRPKPTSTQPRHPLPRTLSLTLEPAHSLLSHSLSHSRTHSPSVSHFLCLSHPPRYSIVEGTHPLWGGVSEPYKHMIRSFLVHFQLQILSQVSEEFNFRNGSIGNFFFAGSRTFFRSLESAVFLFR